MCDAVAAPGRGDRVNVPPPNKNVFKAELLLSTGFY